VKREHTLMWLVLAAVALYFFWDYVRDGFAWAGSVFNPQRSFVVDGTAHSGADATVLTNTCIGPEGIS